MSEALPLFHARYFPLALTLVLLMLVLAFHIGAARIREGAWQVMHVERQFRAIFENAPEGILIIDALSHRILEANPFICQALGASSSSELNRLTYEAICTNGELDATEFFPRLSAKATVSVERRFQGNGHPELSAEVTGSCLQFGDRDVYLLFIRDLAPRKLLEKMRTESAERFGKLFAAAPNALLLIRSADHTIVDANPAALSLIGKKRDEVIGRICHRFICPSETGKCPITDLGQDIDNTERLLIGAGNTRIPILKQVTKLDLSGVPHLLESFIDIRHRKNMEQALATAKEAAEAANQEKSRFIAHMSHEIRTPMNALLGLIDILRAEIEIPRQKHYLELIRNAGESLLALLNDILDFSRIGAGRMELDETPFDLHALLGNTLELLSGKAASKHLELGSSLDASVPRWVIGDQFRLRQILLNLLNNAVKFTERGSIRLSASLAQDRGDGSVIVAFTVTDTGIGIPSDQMSHLFRSYSQVHHNGPGTREGAGLGLAICRQLVHLMRGEIDVTSTPGQGSSFRFTVRLTRHEQGPADVPPALTSGPVKSGPAGNLLLVEDDPINGRLAETILSQHGWNVTTVTSGSEAQHRAATEAFDLLLTDLQLPDSDGLALARAIREKERPSGGHLPIIAVTANASPADRQTCLDAGMDGYLPKPYTPQRLLAVIDATLAGCRKRGDDSILIDMDHLLRRVCGQTDVLRKLIEIFLGKYPGMMKELEESWAMHDLSRISSRAHTFKGTIGTFAADRVFEAVSAVERAARANDAAGVDAAMTAFVPLSRTFATELETLAGKLDAATGAPKEPTT
ncbi:MAG TPA: ATP-binding protein [Candidatus Ozemobacteraceae bacterium]